MHMQTNIQMQGYVDGYVYVDASDYLHRKIAY